MSRVGGQPGVRNHPDASPRVQSAGCGTRSVSRRAIGRACTLARTMPCRNALSLAALAGMACAPFAVAACNILETLHGGDAAASATAAPSSTPPPATSEPRADTTAAPSPTVPPHAMPVRPGDGGAHVAGADGGSPWLLPSGFPTTLPPMPSGFPSTLPPMPSTLPSTLPSGWPKVLPSGWPPPQH
jgi:hypothetical protein